MILAQVDVSATGAVSDFAGKFGFPALLVVILLYGLWKMLESNKTERQTRDDRDEKREEARRVEREADRAAHIAALKAHGERLEAHTASLNTVGEAVRGFDDKLERVLAARPRVG
jgi:flagellar biosynthesis/type III secretory pathway M-ring protein FliF/YscJ